MRRYIIFISVFIFLAGGTLPSNTFSQNEAGDAFLEVVGMEDNTEKVNKLIALSVHYYRYNLDSSLMCSDMALVLSEKLKYPEGIAEANYKKSLAYKKSGNFIDAIDCAQKALDIAESIQDSVLLAKVNYMLGNLKTNTSFNVPAMDHFKVALNIYLNIKDTANAAIVYSGLGNYFLETSLYDSAAIYFHKYLQYADFEVHSGEIAKIIGNLGKVYRLMDEYENSRKFLEQALELNRKTNDFSELATLYTRLGSLEVDLENYSAARVYYKLADSIFRKYNIADGFHGCQVNFGTLNWLEKEYEQSLKNFDSAMSYYREQDHAEGMIVVWEGKAMVFYHQGYYDTALIYCDSGTYLAKKTNSMGREEEVLEILMLVYSKNGEWEKATTTLIRLNEIDDSLNNLAKTVTINDLRFRYNREKDLLQILNLETKNLQRTKQRNAFLFTGLGIVLLAVYLLVFFRYRARKNQIISEQKISRLEEEKKLLAARFLVEGEEKERKRIATAIHDSLGVLLSTSKMHITAIKDDNPENKVLIDKATKFLDEASGEMRKISHNMMPGLLSKLGLCEALEDLFETLDEADGIKASMDVVGPRQRLPENKEIMIYRVLQEMVNNTIKHAEAQNINLTLIVHPDQLDVSYADDGKGFNVNDVLGKKTMGVQSIRSRVKFLDGIINIDSSPGNGTVYRISIPLNPDRALASV